MKKQQILKRRYIKFPHLQQPRSQKHKPNYRAKIPNKTKIIKQIKSKLKPAQTQIEQRSKIISQFYWVGLYKFNSKQRLKTDFAITCYTSASHATSFLKSLSKDPTSCLISCHCKPHIRRHCSTEITNIFFF